MNPQQFPLELKGNKLFIDNSTLSTISSCFRKGAYGFLARRREVKPRAALFFGGAIHKALEIRDREQQILCTREIEEKMIDGLVEYFSDAEHSDDYRNLSYAINTIQQYNKTWQIDAQVAIELPTGEIAVELPFAFSMGVIEIFQDMWVTDPDHNNGASTLRYVDTIEVIFTGKIDRVCKQHNLLYVLDHKTTSMGGPTFFDEFFVSHQFRGYKWALQQMIHQPIEGVIINALICRPPLKSGSVNFTFDRQTIAITDEQVTLDWQESFMSIVQMFINCHITCDYPMFTNSCITKYGRCEFFSVCQLPPPHRDAMLFSGIYETNTWNPLEDAAKPLAKHSTNLPGLFQ